MNLLLKISSRPSLLWRENTPAKPRIAIAGCDDLERPRDDKKNRCVREGGRWRTIVRCPRGG